MFSNIVFPHPMMDFAAHLGEEDRAVFRNACRQILNYVPNNTMPKESAFSDSPLRLILDKDCYVDRPNNAFAWKWGLRDAETLSIRAMFHPDMFSEQQVERFTESVLDLAEYLSDAENLGKEVREIRTVVSKRYP